MVLSLQMVAAWVGSLVREDWAKSAVAVADFPEGHAVGKSPARNDGEFEASRQVLLGRSNAAPDQAGGDERTGEP